MVATKSALVPTSNKQALMTEYENLGSEIQEAQKSFGLSVQATIQRAYEIGRIAYKAKECIRTLPTKAEKAKAENTPVSKLADYKKPTFEQWIKAYTKIGKDTIYSMIRLYEFLQDNPDYKIPEDMGWKECFGSVNNKQNLLKGEEIEDDEVDEDGNTDSSHEKFESERKAFNKTYEKLDKLLAQFLDTSENEKLKSIIVRWKYFLANDLSGLTLPED